MRGNVRNVGAVCPWFAVQLRRPGFKSEILQIHPENLCLQPVGMSPDRWISSGPEKEAGFSSLNRPAQQLLKRSDWLFRM